MTEMEPLGPSGLGMRHVRSALDITFTKSQSRAISMTNDYSRTFTSRQTLSNSKEAVGHSRKDTVVHFVLMWREELKFD